MKIGSIAECFKEPLEKCIEAAGQLGLQGVQLYAADGPFSAGSLTDESKRAYKDLLRKHRLTVSALCGDMGGFGFEHAGDNPLRIQKTKEIIDLAADFGAPVVTTHIGVIPADKRHAPYEVMLSALTECGRYAKSRGVTLAIETGPEKAAVLLAFLQDTQGGVGVNLDPANFVMVTGQDAAEAVYLLKDYIVHTHAKDGIRLDKNQNPADVYHAFALGGVEALNACKGFQEVPLGQGQVNWTEYLQALRDIGFDGFLTIERETGENPRRDMTLAAGFLRNALADMGIPQNG